MSLRPPPELDQIPADAVRTRTCALWVDRVVRGRFLPGVEVALPDAVENVAATARLTGGRTLPALIDLRALRAQSAEARAYLAGPEATRVANAVALLIGSPLSCMVGNFYLGFNRPEVPTRLFTSHDEALAWLEQHLPPSP
ncbi:MAG: hypothetical protein U0325_13520 [Polyangiales bacterium]